MSNYYIVVYDPPWAGPVSHPVDGLGIDLMQGKKYDSYNESAKYNLEVDKLANNPTDFPPLDYFSCADLTVFMSNKMRQCLEENGVDNIDYYNVEITYVATGEQVDCFAANVIGMLQAVDEAASDCQYLSAGHLLTVDKRVLNKEKLEGLKFVRFYEFATLLIVAEHIKEALEAAGVTGIYFVEPEEWDDSML